MRVLAVLAGCAALAAAAFDLGCNSNYASYYGQNSARNQRSLGEYCRDATEDVIILAFMNGFPNVMLNFANACETTFEDSALLHCPSMASDIKFCQSRGKAVLLSMGGASGAYGFSGEADGTKFADTVWDVFFKGNATQRPFDDAVLDGVDLDIEGGGSAGYASFVSQLRSHYASDAGRRYYIAAAPQCPFPDAYLGPVLDSAWFDMVFVQFYNNYCGLNAYPGWFNFGDWDNWAKTRSANKNVKVFIGAPGSPSAASSGYIDGQALGKIYKDTASRYSSLGGIMTWDVSQARTSGLAGSIRAMLDAGGTCGSHPPPYTTTTTTATTTTTTTTTSTVTATTESMPAPTACPVSGAPCTSGQQGCSGEKYAVCNNGAWYVGACAAGTQCTMSGGSAVCGWPTGAPGCSASSGLLGPGGGQDQITEPWLRPHPAIARGAPPVRVEVIVSGIAGNRYAAVVKVQAEAQPFGADWALTYALPAGQTVDWSSRGAASSENGTAAIQSDPRHEPARSMAAVFQVAGAFVGAYVLPDPGSAVFLGA
ncbi:Chitinase 2 [Coemansia javaensis]|uniref:chitinase n=1 Tax=Coemansia javaensis TaxID=2761396 RepID=A0A9W8LL15_9FUNG|nr:Chitinase 2 [Coemansia javaensis]